jgi:hypothetical protein
MQSKAATVSQYLTELPADRREAITAVRNTILKNLDKGYTERMSYGMIGYAVPHSIFPAGYHCDPKQPLPFAGLASQKQHMSLYMMGISVACDGEHVTDLVKWFKDAWAKSGKKPLDMGVACIRFKKLDDMPLDVIGEAIRRMPLKKFIESYERTLKTIAQAKAVRSAAKGKIAPKKAAKKAPAKRKPAKAKK